MANTKQKPPATATVGDVFTRARGKRGVTFERIARDLEGAPWFITITDQAIANYHHDKVAKPDLEIVDAIADYYDLTLADLPADVRARLERQRDRLIAKSSKRRKYAPRDSNPEPADTGTNQAEAA